MNVLYIAYYFTETAYHMPTLSHRYTHDLSHNGRVSVTRFIGTLTHPLAIRMIFGITRNLLLPSSGVLVCSIGADWRATQQHQNQPHSTWLMLTDKQQAHIVYVKLGTLLMQSYVFPPRKFDVTSLTDPVSLWHRLVVLVCFEYNACIQ